MMFLHKVNGTIELRPELVPCPDTHYVTAAFLGLLSGLGTVLNLLLAATIASSRQLRRRPLPALMLSLAAAHTLETAVRIPLGAVFAAHERWPLGVAACRLDAFVSDSLLMVGSVSVLLLCAERALLLRARRPHCQQTTARRWLLVALAVTWTVPGAVSLCLLTGRPLTLPHEGRCGCGAADGDLATTAYAAVSVTLGHLLPCVGTLACVLQMALVFRRERRQMRRLRQRRGPADTWQLFATPRLQAEQRPTVTVLTVTALYLLLCLPYTLMVHLQAAIGRPKVNNTAPLSQQWVADQLAQLDIHELTLLNSSALLVEPSSDRPELSGPVGRLQVVAVTGMHEPVLMWLRHSFLLLYPALVLFSPGPLRLRAELLLLRCRSGGGCSRLESAPVSRTARGCRVRAARSTSGRTPVLFASDLGLQLRRPARPVTGGLLTSLQHLLRTRRAADQPEMVYSLCDAEVTAEEGDRDVDSGGGDGSASPRAARQQRPDSATTQGTDSGVELDSAEMRITDLESEPWWKSMVRPRTKQGRRVHFTAEAEYKAGAPPAADQGAVARLPPHPAGTHVRGSVAARGFPGPRQLAGRTPVGGAAPPSRARQRRRTRPGQRGNPSQSVRGRGRKYTAKTGW